MATEQLTPTPPAAPLLEQLAVAVLGHVDHGKSTLIGRLLADTHSLPQGKLEQVRATCQRNAKPFEYAFLLDALKDEQAQGITIDMARCFFQTPRRRYVIIDAPGHVEFLKNMVTGAAKAEAAFLVIDAKEGVRENSKRHGYIVSMLGITQLAVVINKMDLVDYDPAVFAAIRAEYTAFLARFNVRPLTFIPISAFHGVNLASRSPATPWYDGPTVLEQFEAFHQAADNTALPFRFPVQDVYKFTEDGDDRRILAGTVRAGTLAAGDRVVFYPAGTPATVRTIESFNTPPKTTAQPGEAVGFTLDAPIYVKPGDLMVRADQPRPQVGTRFRANLFWMGRAPMIRGQQYKLKLGTTRVAVGLVKILNVLDASELTSVTNQGEIERHDVGECVLETVRPIAFDLVNEIAATGRFVIVDGHEIAGAGIVLERMSGEESLVKEHVQHRERVWAGSAITPAARAAAYGHGAKFVVFTGAEADPLHAVATALERQLFAAQLKAYYLPLDNVVRGLDADLRVLGEAREEHLRRLGELARIMTDAGQVFLTAIAGADDYDLETLKLLNQPNEIVVVTIGPNTLVGYRPQLALAADLAVAAAVKQVWQLLQAANVIPEYQI